MKIKVSIFLLLIFASTVAQATVSAHIYKETVGLNEAFDLTISINSEAQGISPDLSVLQENFEILSRSKQHLVSIVNGKKKVTNQWIINLIAKKKGKLPIPAIKVGKEYTKLLVINVLDAPKTNSANNKDFKYFILEGEADTSSPYVQAEVIFTVKLFYIKGLTLTGQLEEPVDADNFIVEKLGDDIRYETTRNSCTYKVLERKYALFPQKSGKLRLPVIDFQGKMDDVGSSNFDCRTGMVMRNGIPGFNSPFSQFFSQKPVHARTNRIQIDVKPIPKEFGEGAWLPAKSLTISQSWSPDIDSFRVGQPVTRTITLNAKGLSAIQLPDIPAINDEQFKIYSDKANTKNSFSRNSIISQKEQKLAMIANHDGNYRLPDLKIKWWDTQADRVRFATLNGLEINVKQELKKNAVDKTTSALASPIRPGKQDKISGVDDARDDQFWKYVSFASIGLWLLTLVIMLRGRKISPQSLRPKKENQIVHNITNIKKQLKQACQNSDALAAKKQLILLAQGIWQDKTINSLVAIANLVDNMSLKKAILELDQILYSPSQKKWSGKNLSENINQLSATGKKTDKKNVDPLPQLYQT